MRLMLPDTVLNRFNTLRNQLVQRTPVAEVAKKVIAIRLLFASKTDSAGPRQPIRLTRAEMLLAQVV